MLYLKGLFAAGLLFFSSLAGSDDSDVHQIAYCKLMGQVAYSVVYSKTEMTEKEVVKAVKDWWDDDFSNTPLQIQEILLIWKNSTTWEKVNAWIVDLYNTEGITPEEVFNKTLYECLRHSV